VISPELGRMAFRIAFAMFAVSAVLSFILPRGTAEHVISVVTLVLGLAFMGIIFVLVRYISR
jgi:hypothetical protein